MLRHTRTSVAVLAGGLFFSCATLPCPAQGLGQHGQPGGGKSGIVLPPKSGTGTTGAGKTGFGAGTGRTGSGVSTGGGKFGAGSNTFGGFNAGVTGGANPYPGYQGLLLGGQPFLPNAQQGVTAGWVTQGNNGQINLLGRWWETPAGQVLNSGTVSNANPLTAWNTALQNTFNSNLNQALFRLNGFNNPYGFNPFFANYNPLLQPGFNNPFFNPFVQPGFNNPFVNPFLQPGFNNNAFVNPFLQPGFNNGMFVPVNFAPGGANPGFNPWNSPFANPWANPFNNPFANPWGNPLAPGLQLPFGGGFGVF
jgi:hypothetical protein